MLETNEMKSKIMDLLQDGPIYNRLPDDSDSDLTQSSIDSQSSDDSMT